MLKYYNIIGFLYKMMILLIFIILCVRVVIKFKYSVFYK